MCSCNYEQHLCSWDCGGQEIVLHDLESTVLDVGRELGLLQVQVGQNYLYAVCENNDNGDFLLLAFDISNKVQVYCEVFHDAVSLLTTHENNCLVLTDNALQYRDIHNLDAKWQYEVGSLHIKDVKFWMCFIVLVTEHSILYLDKYSGSLLASRPMQNYRPICHSFANHLDTLVLCFDTQVACLKGDYCVSILCYKPVSVDYRADTLVILDANTLKFITLQETPSVLWSKTTRVREGSRVYIANERVIFMRHTQSSHKPRPFLLSSEALVYVIPSYEIYFYEKHDGALRSLEIFESKIKQVAVVGDTLYVRDLEGSLWRI